MAIVLNGTTGITAPDISVTAQSTDITTTGDITAVDATLSGGVYLGGTGAANYLDDYEEGTFTPTLNARDSDFSSVTYTSTYTNGVYTKVGNRVMFSLRLTWTAFSGGSGELRVTGFPFAQESDASIISTSLCSAFGGGSWTNNPTTGRWFSSTIMELGYGSGNITVAMMPSNGYAIIQGHYQTTA